MTGYARAALHWLQVPRQVQSLYDGIVYAVVIAPVVTAIAWGVVELLVALRERVS